MVNGTRYMEITSFAGEVDEPYDRWRLPHTLVPDAPRVLIVGAGAGNDASAALAAGAQYVTAVEIDPAIYALGKQLHPDQPYSDPRVEVVVDDARHFAETSSQRFDLIVFSHLDSHTALSGFTNMRLDDYVYTVESFRSFSRLLEPGGAMYVSFWALRPWIGSRIRANLETAWGERPLELLSPLDVHEGKQILLVHYLASADQAVLERAAAHSGHFQGFDLPEDVRPSTDDWPYLYIKPPSVPRPMLLLAVLVLVSATSALSLVMRVGSGNALAWFDRHFFFLGAAFLPMEPIMAIPGGAILLTVAYTLPFLFAGTIFARSFRDAAHPSAALGANVLGSLVGGLLELTSYWLGLNWLLFIAAGLYALSFRRVKARS